MKIITKSLEKSLKKHGYTISFDGRWAYHKNHGEYHLCKWEGRFPVWNTTTDGKCRTCGTQIPKTLKMEFALLKI